VEHIEQLEALGVEFRCVHGGQQKVYQILIPWTLKEWMDVLNMDGSYFPACCGRISEARDILIDALRAGGNIFSHDLQRFDMLVSGHGGVFDEVAWRQNKKDPIARLLHIWDVIKEHCHLATYSGTSKLDPSDPECMLDVLLKVGQQLAWRMMYKADADNHPPARAWRSTLLGQFIPVLMALAEHVRKLEIDPVEGYGVFGANGELVRVVGGLGVFAELRDVQKCLRTATCAAPERVASLEVRRVRVNPDGSVEKFEIVEVEVPNIE
jgi:hypothetical protein